MRMKKGAAALAAVAAFAPAVWGATAKIGETEYATLAEAIANATDADKITLIDIDADTSCTRISDGFYQSAEKYVVGNGMSVYITSLAGLKYFRDLVNGVEGVADVYAKERYNESAATSQWYSNNIFTGMTAYLLSDIDLSGEEWAPIGQPKGLPYDKCRFFGNFDGTGHTVSNLKVSKVVEEKNSFNGGLFGYITGAQTFSNLTLENVDVTSYYAAGALIGNANTGEVTVRNCKVSGKVKVSVTSSSEAFAGGFVGLGNVSFSRCAVDGGDATGSTIEGLVAGGLIGVASRTVATTLSGNSVSRVTVSSAAARGQAGGLAGRGNYDTTASGNTVEDAVVSAENGVADSLMASGLATESSGNTTGANVMVVSDPITGSGTEDDPYVIANVDALKAFRDRVNAGNTYKWKHVSFAADVDLDGENWVPVGTSAAPFLGTLDGNGKTVRNLKVEDDSLVCAGLLGKIESPAVVKSLTIENATVSGLSHVGALVGSAYTGKIADCRVIGSIAISGHYKVGGLAGEGYARLENCSVDGGENGGTVTSTYLQKDLEGDATGGLVGFRAEGSTIYTSGCSVKNMTVTGTREVGGLFGRAFTSSTITGGSVENVKVVTGASVEYATAEASKMGVGGLVGLFRPNGSTAGTVSDCTVSDVSLDATVDEVKDIARMGYVSGGINGAEFAAPTASQLSVSGITVTGENSKTGTLEPVVEQSVLNGVDHVAAVHGSDGARKAVYETLAGAIAAAEDGDTVSLLVDIELSATVEIPAGANVTLDLGGKTISASGFVDKVNVIENKGTLTVKNGTIKVLDTCKKVYAILNAGGDLTATGVAIESTSGGIRVAGGTGTISDCRITVDSAGETTNAHAVYASDGASATIESGTYSYTGSVAQDTVQAADANTTMTINGGTFTSANSDSSKNPPKVVHTNKESPAIYITGGTFTGELGTNSGYVHASGGTFNVTFYAGVPYLRVSGGLFAQEVTAAMCADGYVPAEETVTIDGKAYYTVISPAVDSVVYAIENTAGVAVPAEWIKANVEGCADGVTRANEAAVAATLGEAGANGVPYWQSYVLGFTPSDAGDNLRIAASAVAVEKTKVAISSEIDASNFNLPAGAKVTFRLAAKDGAAYGGWATLEDGATTPSFTVDLADAAGKTLAVFADIALRESAE